MKARFLLIAALCFVTAAHAQVPVPLGPNGGAAGGAGATPGGTSGQIQTNNGAGGFGAVAAPAGAVVGTTDAQTLTNKSIAASEVNSGTLAAAQMPALTGNCTTTAGAVATTCKVQSVVVNSSWALTNAAGTQVVSGFGFTPSSCDGFGTNSGTTTLANTTLSSHVDSALTQSMLYYSSGALTFGPNVFFGAVDATGANFQIASVTAYGSGSVTLTWGKGGSPAGTFSFSIRCFQ